MAKLSNKYLRGQVAFYIDAAARDRRTAKNPPVAGVEAKQNARIDLVQRAKQSLERAKAYRLQISA